MRVHSNFKINHRYNILFRPSQNKCESYICRSISYSLVITKHYSIVNYFEEKKPAQKGFSECVTDRSILLKCLKYVLYKVESDIGQKQQTRIRI